MGIDETDEVFTAALLQDMAVPLLAKELPDAYTKLFDARAKSAYRLRLSELEVYAFGWHHASAAKMVAKQWNLPETLADLIEVHLSLDDKERASMKDPKNAAMGMSALLPAVDDAAWGEFNDWRPLPRYLSLGRPYDRTALRPDRRSGEMAPMLGARNAGVSLSEHYTQVAAAPA